MRHEHKHSQIPCCDSAQDAWSDYYISAAGALSESYGMTGRAAARDAIRLYAEMLGRERREFLLKHGRKPNLYNIFLHGGPLPAGCRTRKEWIRHTSQEVFVNISSCPCAECWLNRNKAETGKMFCEEFYPAYIFTAASPRAQVNVGRELVNEGDTFCRLSIYLRPANISVEERRIYFEEFDPDYTEPDGELPVQEADYAKLAATLESCFISCARARLGDEAAELVRFACGVKEGLK